MAPSTAHDYLRRIRYDGLDALAQVKRRLLARLARRTHTTTATLDCDASLFVSSGRNARMSCKGERGYMPMLAFWKELGAVVNDDFRNGNASQSGDAVAFLQDTLDQLPPEVTRVNVRSDSAWYQAALLDFCQVRGHAFCIGADQDEAVKQAIGAMREDDWQRLHLCGDPADPEPCVREWACETVHSLNESQRAYRLLVIRKERLQDDLFYGPYVYHALITNMDLALEEQIAWYRQRGQCENQIKELKWDFELRTLPSGDFFVNAAYLRIMTLAYNLVVALKTLALPETYKLLRLKALLFRVLAVPALVVRHARTLYLKLPRGHPHLRLADRLGLAVLARRTARHATTASSLPKSPPPTPPNASQIRFQCRTWTRLTPKCRSSEVKTHTGAPAYDLPGDLGRIKQGDVSGDRPRGIRTENENTKRE